MHSGGIRLRGLLAVIESTRGQLKGCLSCYAGILGCGHQSRLKLADLEVAPLRRRSPSDRSGCMQTMCKTYAGQDRKVPSFLPSICFNRLTMPAVAAAAAFRSHSLVQDRSLGRLARRDAADYLEVRPPLFSCTRDLESLPTGPVCRRALVRHARVQMSPAPAHARLLRHLRNDSGRERGYGQSNEGSSSAKCCMPLLML